MKNNEKTKNCIIYCRVSSSKQAQQGESLELQEKICTEIAQKTGLNVIHVFKESFSGRKEERPLIDEAFAYIKANPKKIDVFIIRAIDRFTRGGTLGYESLGKFLRTHGVTLIDSCGIIQPAQNTLGHLDIEYDWSITRPSEITELVMAQQGKHEVTQILTRTIGAEIALVRDGYHIGPPREGYINAKLSLEGRKKPIQVPDPTSAPFFVKMFELRGAGAHTDQEIVDQINAMGYKSKTRHKWSTGKERVVGTTGGIKLTIQHLQSIMANPIYCGVNNGAWNIKPIKTKYPGLVTIEAFNRANKGKKFIEEKLDGSIVIHKDYNPHSLKRTRDNLQFPFKSVVLCPECNKPFLGSFSKGKSGAKFPFYHCSRKHKYLGINKNKLEVGLAYFLNNLKYETRFIESFEFMLTDKYKEKKKELGDFSSKATINIEELEIEKINKIDAFTSTQNAIIRKEIEKQIEKLEKQIADARTEISKINVTERDIKSFIKYTKYLMEHPEKMLIKQKNLTILKALFGLVFDELPTYTQIVNGTPKLSLAYKLSNEFKDDKSFTAGDERIELPPRDLEALVLPLN